MHLKPVTSAFPPVWLMVDIYLVDAPIIFWAHWRWFLTYPTPVPVWIFFEQFIGKGWKSSIRRIWQIQIIFVIVAVSAGLILRSPSAAKEANNVMSIIGILVVGLNLFRPGLGMTRELLVLKCGGIVWAVMALYENSVPLLTPGYNIVNIEPFGQLVFLGCLVYVVAYRFFQLNFQSGDRFFLYTDGIIEATNASGDLFGWSRFKEFIASHADLSVGSFADELIQRISNWSGKHMDEALDDDLTLVAAEFIVNLDQN